MHLSWAIVGFIGCTPASTPPQWLATSGVAASGAWMWGVVDRPPTSVEVRVHRAPAALSQSVAGAATWRLPALPAGSTVADLSARGSTRPTARAPLTVVQPDFVDVAGQIGLDFEHQVTGWDPTCAESLTALAVSDWDLDGDSDVFVGNLTGPSVAFRSDRVDDTGLPSFHDATAATWLGAIDHVSAASFADFDNDGDPDLFVGRRGANQLYENRMVPDGNAVFVDRSAWLGAPLDQRTTGAAWGDLDGDADLDVYLTNHHWCFPEPESEANSGDQLMRNDGRGFTDITATLDDTDARVSGRLGFAAMWVDVDDDIDVDLVVANDAVGRRGGNVLWRNLGEAGDHALVPVFESGVAVAFDALGKGPNAMGLAAGDIDGDGFIDFATSNIGPNIVLLGDGAGDWVEVGGPAGVQRTVHPWGAQQVTWGTHLFDRDLDGDLDLFVVGGALKGNQPQPHGLFDGHGDGTFSDVSWSSGLASPGHGKASAVIDLDQDGRLDVLVATWGGHLEAWHNRTPVDGGRHLVVRLSGDGTAVPTDAVGARVDVLTAQGEVHTCWHSPRPSLSSSSEPGCHFGLGEQVPTEVTVTWPDGRVDREALDAGSTDVSIGR